MAQKHLNTNKYNKHVSLPLRQSNSENIHRLFMFYIWVRSFSFSWLFWLQEFSDPEKLSASSSDLSAGRLVGSSPLHSHCCWSLRCSHHHMVYLCPEPSEVKDAVQILKAPPTSSGNFAPNYSTRHPGNRK